MKYREYTVTLTERELIILTRIVKQRLKDSSKYMIQNLEPIQIPVIVPLEEDCLEVLNDNLTDMTSYLNLCMKLVNSKNESSLEESM